MSSPQPAPAGHIPLYLQVSLGCKIISRASLDKAVKRPTKILFDYFASLTYYCRRELKTQHCLVHMRQYDNKMDVAVESPGPNQGSTFSMRLPIEGSPRALKVGERTAVAIKAA